MEIIAKMLGNFYVIFIAITVFLLLALIGYFIDQKYPDIDNKKNMESKDLEQRLATAKGKTLSSMMSNDDKIGNSDIEVLDVNANYNDALNKGKR